MLARKDHGADVRALEYLLRSRGEKLAVDGAFEGDGPGRTELPEAQGARGRRDRGPEDVEEAHPGAEAWQEGPGRSGPSVAAGGQAPGGPARQRHVRGADPEGDEALPEAHGDRRGRGRRGRHLAEPAMALPAPRLQGRRRARTATTAAGAPRERSVTSGTPGPASTRQNRAGWPSVTSAGSTADSSPRIRAIGPAWMPTSGPSARAGRSASSAQAGSPRPTLGEAPAS